LEKLVAEGMIRWYGWSTANPDGAGIFAQSDHCTVMQHMLNMARDNTGMLAVCEQFDLASINQSPLGGGMLTVLQSPPSQKTYPLSWDLKRVGIER
jgi:aryl-alcohol dehydrogenase-like predicted oxidoreductase